MNSLKVYNAHQIHTAPLAPEAVRHVCLTLEQIMIFLFARGTQNHLYIRRCFLQHNRDYLIKCCSYILPGSMSKERLSISMSSRLDAALQKSSSTQCTASVRL